MTAHIYPLEEPRRPSSGTNNVWYEDRRTDQVIVFVHGVLSDSSSCWYAKPSNDQPGVYWPDLLLNDKRFAGYSIYLGGYYTDVHATQYEVSDCAEELYNALRRRSDEATSSVLERQTIIFVCHSMGGIVVRYMLTTRPWEFADNRIGLLLIASPSSGSPWADKLDYLLKYFKHHQGIELKWGNWSLEDLDGRFRIVVAARKIKLLGAEACENRFVFDSKWLPPREPVVPRHSAGAYFDRVRMLPNTDHFTCVKPTDENHPAYQFLVDFHFAFSGPGAQELEPIAMSSTAPQVGPGIEFSSLVWDVRINKEGDIYNELTHKGIVLPNKRPYLFELPPAEVQSGHTTPFELIWDGRTTEGVTLRHTKEPTPNKVEMSAEFLNLPTSKNPAHFAIRCWDWNVYSMNMEEYRQKPNWREDGMDYAEKYLAQKWKNFMMIISFPKPIVFAKRPFFEIYDSSGGSEVRNDELTAAYQQCFYCSGLLAVLSIQQPPSPFSYRISWLLGESRSGVTSALFPAQRRRQRIFAQKMLRMRRTVDGEEVNDVDEARQIEAGIFLIIASVAEHVQGMLGGAELDPGPLEISLMVLDEDRPKSPPTGNKKLPVLRMVAGTLLGEPGNRSLEMFVGDGNAGRAWKRRMVRVFDHKESDPKRRVYQLSQGARPHCFLVSIPLIDPSWDALIYGILNIGTVDSEQAELLRKIGTSEYVEHLTSFAQSYVLQRLVELLNL